MGKLDLICIVCPVGCPMTIDVDSTTESGYRVEGNKCSRGIIYGIEEVTNPKRVITSTVIIKGGLYKRLPVKTDGSISKDKIFECMELINKVEVSSPIIMGEIIIENILNTGINIVSTRSM